MLPVGEAAVARRDGAQTIHHHHLDAALLRIGCDLLDVGARVRSVAPPRIVDGQATVPMRVVGILDDSLGATFGGATLVVMSLPEAQRLLLEPGRVSAVRAMAAPGVSQDEIGRAHV